MWNWLSQNWLDAIQSFGIIGSLLIAAYTLRVDAKVRRVSNLLKVTEQHRDLWTRLITEPDLARVLSDEADTDQKPVSRQERWFVALLILHINAAYRAMKDGMYLKPEGLRKDIRWIFSFPVAKTVWDNVRQFQDKDFVGFVEGCQAEV